MITLKSIREKRNLSLAEVARMSGLSRRTIEDIERRGDCRISTAYTLAQALGISLDDIYKPELDDL
jgi:transcriptional regulator with XRE-family HTH domain